MVHKGFAPIITILIATLVIVGGISTIVYLSKPHAEISTQPYNTSTTLLNNTVSTESTTTTINNPNLVKVVSVIDGDTIKVLINGETETVRLIGIDTPETVDPRKPVQCFGQEASNKLKSLLSDKWVRLESDSSQGDKDKYQRLLRYVFLEDGTFINKMMISKGYAYEYTYLIPYKYQEEFQNAEKYAREAQLGLWNPNTCNGALLPAETTTSTTTTLIPPTSQTTIVSLTTTTTIPPTTTTTLPPTTTTILSKEIICSYNAYNCSDFKTHAEAQAVFEYCGGINNDVHWLDSDHDGIACESYSSDIPSETTTTIFLPTTTTIISRNINCTKNVYNCSDFATHAEAQAVFEYCGGINNDIHYLDGDHDGIACESLP